MGLTALVEQISGSEAYRVAYEDAKKQKSGTEEANAGLHVKRKALALEKRHAKAQKEEAEQHARMGAELVGFDFSNIALA